MGELHLYAIGVDEVRDIVGAGPKLRENLLSIAQQAFAPAVSVSAASAKPTGLLGRLGPLFKRPAEAPVVTEQDPRPEDFDRMVSGQWIPPERLPASWRLFEALVAPRAWGTIRQPVDDAFINQLDFDLTRAGSPSAFGVAAFLHSQARVGLTPMPGLRLSYWVNGHAAAAAEAYSQALEGLDEGRNREVVEALIGWLGQFSTWNTQAVEAGRPHPDLLGFWYQ